MTSGSYFVPAHLFSSLKTEGKGFFELYFLSVLIAWNESATAHIRAPMQICFPVNKGGKRERQAENTHMLLKSAHLPKASFFLPVSLLHHQ